MLQELLENWRRGKRGPLPQLTYLQLLNALVLIDTQGPLGRRTLSQTLQINDGIARGLLERLREQGIVEANEAGVRLSRQGKRRLHSLLNQMSIRKILPLEESDLVPGTSATAVHMAEKSQLGLTGIIQRDEAIKAGAQGSITITIRGGKLVIPPDNKDTADLSPKENDRLRALFNPAENDLILIGFGDSKQKALAGALAAALSVASLTKS